MTEPLPNPISRTDELLYDIATSLRQLTGREHQPDSDLVGLTEPERHVSGLPDIEDYATGNGWYQIPGHPKKLRRDDALQALHG